MEGWGGSISMASALFRVLRIVTRMTQADQIAVIVDQLRIFIRVLDVVYLGGLPQSSVPLADLALVSIAAQDIRPLAFPLLAVVVKCFHFNKNPPGSAGSQALLSKLVDPCPACRAVLAIPARPRAAGSGALVQTGHDGQLSA